MFAKSIVSKIESSHAPGHAQDKKNHGGILGGLTAKLDSIKDGAGDKANSLLENTIEKAVEALDIPNWYSMHVMSTCEGDSASDAGRSQLDATSCSATSISSKDQALSKDLFLMSSTGDFNITKTLSSKFSGGSLRIDLGDFGWLEKVQDSVDTINIALRSLPALYIISIFFGAAAFVGGCFTARQQFIRHIARVNIATSVLTLLFLFIASLLITLATVKATGAINAIGAKIGIEARRGMEFLAITWSATGIGLIAAILWSVIFWVWK